jgi:acetylglutamate kinase
VDFPPFPRSSAPQRSKIRRQSGKARGVKDPEPSSSSNLASDPASVVLTFLESVGRPADAQLYLRLFRELPKESFAIIMVEGRLLRPALASFTEHLRFLNELGLFAPVVLGVFEPGAAAQAAAALAERCAAMSPVVHDAREPGLSDRVREELCADKLPIISLERLRRASRDERFDWVGDLAAALRTRKVVIVRRRGGLGPHDRSMLVLGDGHLLKTHDGGISVINLTTDYDALRRLLIVTGEEAELLEDIRRLLLRPDCDRLVASITSPLNLLRELFTTQGAGTLVKRGTSIARHDSYAAVDLARLEALLVSSFGRRLAKEFFGRRPAAVYLEENYRAAAVIEAAAIAPYLTKFAVDRVAQGEGMGRDLWSAIARDFPSLCWRARSDNPIARWYADLCDGMVRSGPWVVYWRAIDPSRIAAVVEDVAARPNDFEADPL